MNGVFSNIRIKQFVEQVCLNKMDETTLDPDIILSWFSSSHQGFAVINSSAKTYKTNNPLFKDFLEYLHHLGLGSSQDLVARFYETLPKSGSEPKWMTNEVTLKVPNQFNLTFSYDYYYISPTTLYLVYKGRKTTPLDQPSIVLPLWSFIKMHLNDCLVLIETNGKIYQSNSLFEQIYTHNPTKNSTIYDFFKQRKLSYDIFKSKFESLPNGEICSFSLTPSDSPNTVSCNMIRYSTTDTSDISPYILLAIPFSINFSNSESGICNIPKAIVNSQILKNSSSISSFTNTTAAFTTTQNILSNGVLDKNSDSSASSYSPHFNNISSTFGSPSPYNKKSIYDSITDGQILYGNIDIDGKKLYNIYPIIKDMDEIQLNEIINSDSIGDIQKAIKDICNKENKTQNVIIKYINIRLPYQDEYSVCDLYISYRKNDLSNSNNNNNKNISSSSFILSFALVSSYSKTSFANVTSCSTGDPVVNILDPYFIIDTQLIVKYESEGVKNLLSSSLINVDFIKYFSLTSVDAKIIIDHLSNSNFKCYEKDVSRAVYNHELHFHISIISVPLDPSHKVGICMIRKQSDPHLEEINQTLMSIIDFPYAIIKNISDNNYTVVECSTNFQTATAISANETIQLVKAVENTNLYSIKNATKFDVNWIIREYIEGKQMLYCADLPARHSSSSATNVTANNNSNGYENEIFRRGLSKSFDIDNYDSLFFRTYTYDIVSPTSEQENRYIVVNPTSPDSNLFEFVTSYVQTKGAGYEIIELEDIEIKKRIICLISIQPLVDISKCSFGLIDLSKQLGMREKQLIQELNEECLKYKTLYNLITRNSWCITLSSNEYCIKTLSQPAQSILYAKPSEEFVNRIDPHYRSTFVSLISKINPDPIVAFELPLLTINNDYSWMKCTFILNDSDILCILGPNSLSSASIPDDLFRKAFSVHGCCHIFINPENKIIYSITLDQDDSTNYSNTTSSLASLKSTQLPLYNELNKYLTPQDNINSNNNKTSNNNDEVITFETTYNTQENYEIPVRVYIKTFQPDCAYILVVPIRAEQTLKDEIEKMKNEKLLLNEFLEYMKNISGKPYCLLSLSTSHIIKASKAFNTALEGKFDDEDLPSDNQTAKILKEFHENMNKKEDTKILRLKTKRGNFYKINSSLTKINGNDYCVVQLEQPEVESPVSFEFNPKLIPSLLMQLSVGYCHLNIDTYELRSCSDRFKYYLGNTEGKNISSYLSEENLKKFEEKLLQFLGIKKIQTLSEQFTLQFHKEQNATEMSFQYLFGDEGCYDDNNSNTIILFLKSVEQNRDLNEVMQKRYKTFERINKTLVQISYNLYCKMDLKTKKISEVSSSLEEIIGKETNIIPIPNSLTNDFDTKIKNLENLQLPITKFSFELLSKKTNKKVYLVLKAVNTSDQGIAQILISDETDIVQTKHELSIVQEEAKNAIEAKQKFRHFMSHELRNQATIITMGLDELFMKKKYDVLICQNMKTAGEALSNLLDDFTTIEAIEGDQTQINYSNFTFKELMMNLQNTYNDQVSAKKLQFIVDMKTESITRLIRGDIDKISFVLRSFLNNAISHTESGDIRLYCLAVPSAANNNNDDNMIYIKAGVRDTGTGIEDSKLPHIFDKYKYIIIIIIYFIL